MRAVKVRGVYDSIEETQRNAARLQKLIDPFTYFQDKLDIGYHLIRIQIRFKISNIWNHN